MGKLSKYRVLLSGVLSPVAAVVLYALVYGTLTQRSADAEIPQCFWLTAKGDCDPHPFQDSRLRESQRP